MSKRIVEGLWDCPYCTAKGIGGLTKHCPACGHPQDEGTKFYLGTERKYLEDELAAQYGQGADWVCPFCGGLNRVHFQYCANCGASRDAAEKDYFTAKVPPSAPQQPASPLKPARGKKKRILPAILLVLAAVLLFTLWPRTYEATITSADWAREIAIEAYCTVQESDWSVPAGGRLYAEKTEFSHYRPVLDHYETRTREVSEQVYDGEDYHTSYTDNGDGTFTESTYSSPRYRTEWHTETYQVPIYRDEPVYATKYYYDIDKWLIDRTETSAGANSAPYWPNFSLAENERTGPRSETYILHIATEKEAYSVPLPLRIWEKYCQGDRVTITVVNGSITKINDEAIG